MISISKRLMAAITIMLCVSLLGACSSNIQQEYDIDSDKPAEENSNAETESDVSVLENNIQIKLPLTQTFEDFNSIEKICRLPQDIMTEGADKGYDPEFADVTLYVPWNTLVFYYNDYRYNDDLIHIGHVISGMEMLADMGDEFVVTMELIGDMDNQTDFTDITMTAGDTVITATLDNSETSREFLKTLPRTLEMNRYGDREYYGRIAPLSQEGDLIATFENGDVTYYPAGPSFAVFFDGENDSGQSGLIRMGKITSDLAVFDSLEDSIEMLIEVDY